MLRLGAVLAVERILEGSPGYLWVGTGWIKVSSRLSEKSRAGIQIYFYADGSCMSLLGRE